MQKKGINVSSDVSSNQEIDFRGYLLVLKKRWATVVTFLVITVLLVIIATFSMTPLYTASSQVLIERNSGSSSMERSYSYWQDPQFLDTQFKIITSFNVVKRVVENVQIDTKYKKYFLKEKKGRFKFVKSVKKKIINSLYSFSSQSPLDSVEKFNDPEILVKVEPVSDKIIIVKAINDSLNIEPEHQTRIVNIMYSHWHPGMAKLITNSLIKAYKEELQEIKHSSSSDTLKWMTEKAEEERKKLENSEIALQDYMRKNDIITIENKLAIFPQKISEFSSQLSIVQAERKKLESKYSQIEVARKKSQDLETIPVFSDSTVLQAIRDKIYTAEQELKQISKTYGYKNPVMIKAKEELNSLKREKRYEIKRIIASTKNAFELSVSQEKNIAELLNTTKNELLNLNDKVVQYSIMKREVNTNSVLYDTLTASLKQASVTVQSQPVNVWVIKEAYVPPYPSKPHKTRNVLLGIVLGMLGGIGLAFFVEYIDNTVQSAADLEQRFGLTVLGAVEGLKGKERYIESFIKLEPLSPVAESYRLIRSAILFSSVDRPPRQILFTSMSPSEGKTITTVNMARILSQSKKKVVVIDCDMRKPRTHKIFSLPNSVGLSSYLTGNTQDNIVNTVPGEEFALITSGPIPPNPSELLDSSKMERLLGVLAEVYDFILLDSPPVQSVTDSLSLSTIVDGTVLVVRAGETTIDMLESGLKKLSGVSANLLGFILNGVTKISGTDDYYHGYHEYYSKED